MDRPLDPPRVVQVLSISGEWADALLLGWNRDRSRGWVAVVVLELPAGQVREQRHGAAAHRPDEHPSWTRRRWDGRLPYET